ncbi:FAD-binding oxidoreductase [Actinophytocola sp.]|uniref:FAD-binding oxidoreductase n=1 Tax=Actinophytocola sp. TaxID=1872138 RepID=UPI002ED49406
MTVTTPPTAELRAAVRGPVVCAGDGDYDTARRVWNRGVDRTPLVVVRCVDEGDVVTAVRFARDNGLPLSVRAGGHDWAGRSVRDGGVVVDLSAMRGVTIRDGTTHGAIGVVRGGARAGDVSAAVAPHGFAAVLGTVSHVGVAGLTLGGGYGHLIGRHGLASDNLLAARVVLADGTAVTARADEHPDLFWALRGGGGNFGVVTELCYQLHPLRTVLGGAVMFGLDAAPSVLRGYRELTAAAPDELNVIACLFTSPMGQVLALLPIWCGDPADGEAHVGAVASLGEPLAVQIGQLTLPDVLGLVDGNVADDRQACADSRWLPGQLSDDATDLLVAAFAEVSSPYSAVAVHHFHGAACRVPAEATAWAMRTEHRQVEIIASWPADDPRDIHREWVRALSSALAPHALPGGYPNLLGTDEHERVRLAHGASLDRLRNVKRQYDPDRVFAAVAGVEDESRRTP